LEFRFAFRMTSTPVPHNPLDIIPVPANSIFCKACSTVHTTRVLLCPALRLDICAIHKTVFLPHEKSIYQNSHLQDVDTECSYCIYGSEKKLNRALSRSNSRALRASITHKDVVFCVYCWAPASKKCDHLSSCREHSSLYIRSQVDVNSKWWLRPSDFACHLCPPNDIMAKKAQEWTKNRVTAPASDFFGDDWADWKDYIEGQIMKLHPGAFQTWGARCDYVTWMNGLGRNEMLYLRYLAYTGAYPVTIIYAETGTIPRTIQYEQSSQPSRVEAPPPYVDLRSPNRGQRVPTPEVAPPFPNATMPPQPMTWQMPFAPPEQGFQPIMPHPSQPERPPTFSLAQSNQEQIPPVVAPVNQLARPTTFTGPGRTFGECRMPQSSYHSGLAAHQPQIQSMHSKAPSQTSLIRPPQFQTGHISRPSQYSNGTLAQQPNPIGQLALPQFPQSGHQTMPSHVSQGHQQQYSTYQHAPPIDSIPRRVSFANQVPHHAVGPQHQLPANPVTVQYGAPPPTMQRQTAAPSTANPSMAHFLAQLRAARTPAQQVQHHQTPSQLPGAYPTGHPADDDWETVTELSETDSDSVGTPMPQVSIPCYPAYSNGLSYQGVPERNPVYATFQRAYAQAAGGQYGNPQHSLAAR
jgi:hypothetical protein